MENSDNPEDEWKRQVIHYLRAKQQTEYARLIEECKLEVVRRGNTMPVPGSASYVQVLFYKVNIHCPADVLASVEENKADLMRWLERAFEAVKPYYRTSFTFNWNKLPG